MQNKTSRISLEDRKKGGLNCSKLKWEKKLNGLTNNTLENLRFLCPNCHSLQATYVGANAKLKKKKVLLV